jgi:hypothetical protein
MVDRVAYVVDARSHTVITAVLPAAREEAVFTIVDNVVIA